MGTVMHLRDQCQATEFSQPFHEDPQEFDVGIDKLLWNNNFRNGPRLEV
jgi:hypothetical protein